MAAELNRRSGRRAGPFWGCPPSQVERLGRRDQAVAPRARRSSDRPSAPCGAPGCVPKSCWQLLGAGSVGQPDADGDPVLLTCARSSTHGFDVWPFTTGLGRRAIGTRRGRRRRDLADAVRRRRHRSPSSRTPPRSRPRPWRSARPIGRVSSRVGSLRTSPPTSVPPPSPKRVGCSVRRVELGRPWTGHPSDIVPAGCPSPSTR